MGPKKDRKIAEKGTKSKPCMKAKGKETKAKRSVKAKGKQKTVAKLKSQPYKARKQKQTGKGENTNAGKSRGSIQTNKAGRKRKQKEEPATKQLAKRPKKLMWEAFDTIPELGNQVLEWEKSIPKKRFCTNFVNDQDDSAEMTFVEKIYQMENELCLKSDKYRNNNDWIKVLYEACQQEINQTKDILSKIYELKEYMPILNKENRKQNQSLEQELQSFGVNPAVWIGGRNETAPPSCGSVIKKVTKNSVISAGQYVAAFVILDQKIAEIPDSWENGYFMTHANITDGSWILARCIRPPEKKRKDYLIADIDDLDDVDDDSIPDFKFLGKALPQFRVPRKALIPLPTCIADPELNPESVFPVGADVLALYRETTSFFAAVVEEPPKSITDPYKLRFKDENQKIQNHISLVLQKYVLEYRDIDDLFTKNELNQLQFIQKIEFEEIPL